MAHYAFLDDQNIVTEVIVGVNESELLDGLAPEEWYSNFRRQRCIRTSYNGRIRARFAGIGYIYDEARDAFIEPQPFSSWTLDDATTEWVPPTPMPMDGKFYLWVEPLLQWVEPVQR